MTTGYRLNGKRVTREEFMANKRGIDFDAPCRIGIVGDYEAYECPVTGRMIQGRAAHRENLKQTGCRLLEEGESRDYGKRRREERAENVRKLVNNMYDSISGEL